MTDKNTRETTVVKTSGSSGGWIFAIVLVLLLAAGAWYMLVGPGGSQVDVNVEAPATTEAPASGGDTAPAPAEGGTATDSGN